MNEVKNAIKRVVIDREYDEVSFPSMPLNVLQSLFVEMNITLTIPDNWETNGWQCDYWWKFNQNGLPYVISGGLFSDFIWLSLDVDKLNGE